MLKQKLATIKTVQNDFKNKTGFIFCRSTFKTKRKKNAKRLDNKYFVESK